MTPDERAKLVEDIARSGKLRAGIVEQAIVSKEFDVAAAWMELQKLDERINKRVLRVRRRG